MIDLADDTAVFFDTQGGFAEECDFLGGGLQAPVRAPVVWTDERLEDPEGDAYADRAVILAPASAFTAPDVPERGWTVTRDPDGSPQTWTVRRVSRDPWAYRLEIQRGTRPAPGR